MAFPTAAAATVDSLLAAADQRGILPGESVPDVGGPGGWSNYLVIGGQVGIVQSSEDGRQAVVHVGGPDWFFGLPPEEELPAPLSVVGLTDARTMAWGSDTLGPHARTDIGLATDLLGHAGRWIMFLTRRVEVMTFDSALQRLAAAMLDHGDLNFDATRPTLSRSQLATLLGASREMTSRAISQLEAQGAIARVGRSGIVLLDAQRLRDATRHTSR